MSTLREQLPDDLTSALGLLVEERARRVAAEAKAATAKAEPASARALVSHSEALIARLKRGIEKVRRELYPRFVDGDRHAPPEDVGGLPRFEDFLNAMVKPRDAQHREVVDWYGGRFEPEDIGVYTINDRIAQLARRRTLGKAGFAKSESKRH